MDKNKNVDEKELFLLSVYSSFVGITLMLGGLGQYGFSVNAQRGRFFYGFSFLLILFWLAGSFIVFSKTRVDVVFGSFQKRFVTKPVIVTSTLVLNMLIFGMVSYLSQRYPYLNFAIFKYGLLLSCLGIGLGIGNFYLLKLKAIIEGYTQKIIPFTHYVNNHYVIMGILVVLIGWAYKDSFHGVLLKDDELYLMTYARQSPPFSAFIHPPAVYPNFYRPLHLLIMWVFYHMFGFDYSKYQLASLLAHLMVSISLYYVLYAICKNRLVSLTLTLVFSLHIYASVMVIFVTGALWWFGMVSMAFYFIILKSDTDMKSYLFLGALLLLSLLVAEYGLGILIAVCLLAMFEIIQAKSLKNRWVHYLLMSFIVGLVYFLIRGMAVGILPPSGGGSSGYFMTFYQNPRFLGLKFFVYTLAANLIATFTPIFSEVGVIIIPSLILIGLGLLLFLLFVFLARRFKSDSAGYFLIGLIFMFLYLGKNIIQESLDIEYYRLALGFSLHSILSASLLILYFKWREISKQHKRLTILSIGLILGSGIVTLFYFRWRTHYLSLIGWVILLSIGWTYLNRIRWGKVIIASLILIAFMMSNEMVGELSTRLPAATIQSNQKYLCLPVLPDDLVNDLVEYYDINPDEILPCR